MVTIYSSKNSSAKNWASASETANHGTEIFVRSRNNIRNSIQNDLSTLKNIKWENNRKI